MRRFSQRSQLVTLSEINITPLLDLAFVLLIIFIITTPLLTQSIELNLPHGGAPESKHLKKSDIRTVEISNTGYYKLDARQMGLSDADRNCVYDSVAKLMDGCQKHGITRYSWRTDPSPDK
jgi:biopolymer transport protein ExbD